MTKRPYAAAALLILITIGTTACDPRAGETSPMVGEGGADKDWTRARIENTAAAYSAFLEEHPGTLHSDQAASRLARLEASAAAFAEASRIDDLEAWTAFLRSYAGTPECSEAESRRAWCRAREATDVAVIQEFLASHGDTRLGPSARQRLDHLFAHDREWRSAIDSDDTGPIKAFIRKFPDSPNTRRARERLSMLERAQAWSSVAKNDVPAVRRFIAAWTDGPEIEEAWSLAERAYADRESRVDVLVPRARSGDTVALKKLELIRSDDLDLAWFFLWEFQESDSESSGHRTRIVPSANGEPSALDEEPYYVHPRRAAGIGSTKSSPDPTRVFGLGSQIVFQGGPIAISHRISITSDATVPLFFEVRENRGLLYLGGKGSVTVDGRTWTLGAEYDADTLVTLLESPVADERAGAAWFLGHLGLGRLANSEVASSLMRLLSSDNRTELAAGGEALARLAPELHMSDPTVIPDSIYFGWGLLPDIRLETLVNFAIDELCASRLESHPAEWPPDGFLDDGTPSDPSRPERIVLPVGKLRDTNPRKDTRIMGGSSSVGMVSVSYGSGVGRIMEKSMHVPSGLGSRLVFHDSRQFGDVLIDPDSDSFLEIVKTASGWVYHSGDGCVTYPADSGVRFDVGRHRELAVCLDLLRGNDKILKEAAFRELTRMDVPATKKDLVVEALEELRNDPTMEEAAQRAIDDITRR